MIPASLIVSLVIAIGIAYWIRITVQGPVRPAELDELAESPEGAQFREFLRRVQAAIVPGARKLE